MNTLTIKSPIAVMTDGELTLVVTDIPMDWVKEQSIPNLDRSITVKNYFLDNSPEKPIFCHLFPAASIISSDLLKEIDGLVDKAIKFKPD